MNKEIPKSTVELSMPKKVWIPYLMLLGITLGVGLCAGVFAAPVIFHADDLLGGGVLSHYQEGLIMTQIFLKMNWLVNITSIAILVAEGYHFLRFYRDQITFYSAFVTVWTGFMFTLYYTPQIVEFQKQGESILDNKLFQNAHMMSEWDFKIFIVALTVLLGRYLYRKIV
ncbi:DUF4149 domain-containing protein [Hydrogenimonas thermophila]|uniref:DUF4149 domain-containing protein n=1 Tax=Hydrogenimonas thermophila TaxID=223786 RepID=UPI0029371D80|nr:DUF4149 domain-containing protein [Hydrogenimonas thermophila]WOE71151.1 DUF4149 domain-containing protein [Hydrogenimonas thermophila]WOE73669.1 DUF4149 domain-containing protein [Hydrogenimonas thermophila]